ncbi:hypothetical protein [Bacillus cereus group sp. BfR-BA-01310]|uniref:hypothetical protein n=1 Tax=Bacillus cereus group sp. BfR-BA-01310 TaxID=2920287 RepID=UPI001F5832D7|nr:hypothetical protein [Bacillus cereus group sp. BfR-BA-01310]
MKARKLVSLALPVMLLGDCATDKVEEKKTESLKVAESEKKKDDSKSTRDIIVPLYKEVDKIYHEGQELQSKKGKTEEESKSSTNKEESNDKVVKEAVIGGGRTLAEERELMGKNAVGTLTHL